MWMSTWDEKTQLDASGSGRIDLRPMQQIRVRLCFIWMWSTKYVDHYLSEAWQWDGRKDSTFNTDFSSKNFQYVHWSIDEDGWRDISIVEREMTNHAHVSTIDWTSIVLRKTLFGKIPKVRNLGWLQENKNVMPRAIYSTLNEWQTLKKWKAKSRYICSVAPNLNKTSTSRRCNLPR